MHTGILRKVLLVLLMHFALHASAQISTRFNRQLSAIIKSPVAAIIGDVKKQQSGAIIYTVRLPLDNFALSYAETAFGNIFHANYLPAAAESTMDSIYMQLLELPYVTADSKTNKKY